MISKKTLVLAIFNVYFVIVCVLVGLSSLAIIYKIFEIIYWMPSALFDAVFIVPRYYLADGKLLLL